MSKINPVSMSTTITLEGMDSILERAITKYGENPQIMMLLEEQSELSKEVCKYARGDRSTERVFQVAEEIADVLIMLRQIELICGIQHEVVLEFMQNKLDRLNRRLNV